MSITKEKKQELIKKFALNDKDSGSASVQIAVLTERINNLTSHLSKFKKDHISRRGLLMLVGRRKNLLNYIKRKDEAKYKELLKALNLRK